MRSTTVAKVYARSLYQLGKESGIESRIAKDCQVVQEIILSSNDLENLLYLEIFTAEEKREVFEAILAKTSVTPLMKNFLYFLIEERRMGLFPGIFQEVILMEDEAQNFIKARIHGKMDQLDPQEEKQICDYLKMKLGKNPVVEYVKNEEILAGVRVMAEDLHFDASFNHQLDLFKQTLLGE